MRGFLVLKNILSANKPGHFGVKRFIVRYIQEDNIAERRM